MIWLSLHLPAAPFGTPTAFLDVVGSLSRVGAIGGHKFKAIGGERWQEDWCHRVIVGHCFCVLPPFYTQTGTLLSTLYINVEVAVKKLGQHFFAIFKAGTSTF